MANHSDDLKTKRIVRHAIQQVAALQEGYLGQTGPTGATGSIGPPGFSGDDGDDGQPGFPGPAGPAGANGSSGSTGPAGPVGPAIYLEAEPGEQGEPGVSGRQGVDGAAGATGAQGPMGPAVYLEAEPGEEGMSGRPGPTGPQGATGASGGMTTLKKTSTQTINGGAGVFVDVTDLTFPVVSGTDYAFEFYITFRSAATTTGWRAGVNCPAGTLDFWAGSDVIANGAAGVATHTERHNVTRDDMTLLTATIAAGVDLNVRIRGRYLCTANGTFAARFANELAANTNIVVQKGSWGWWF